MKSIYGSGLGESLQDVPIAVSAVSSAQLELQGITSTLDIGRAVPSTGASVADLATERIYWDPMGIWI